MKNDRPTRQWTFFSNHAHVLVCLLQDPNNKLREISDRVGITERAVQRIVSELAEAGIVRREKVGRRNRYQLQLDQPLRHPLESHRTIAEVIGAVVPGKGESDQ